MVFPNLFSKILPRVPMTDIYHHSPFSGYSAAGCPPCAISVLLTYSFSVTYSHASTPCRPPRRQVYIVLNIQKILTFPRIRTSFFQIKVGILLYGYLPPIRIGANYSSTQRYFGNPRSPMSMQCGTAEKFGNPVYFIILSQYNTEVGYRLAALPSK